MFTDLSNEHIIIVEAKEIYVKIKDDFSIIKCNSGDRAAFILTAVPYNKKLISHFLDF